MSCIRFCTYQSKDFFCDFCQGYLSRNDKENKCTCDPYYILQRICISFDEPVTRELFIVYQLKIVKYYSLIIQMNYQFQLI